MRSGLEPGESIYQRGPSDEKIQGERPRDLASQPQTPEVQQGEEEGERCRCNLKRKELDPVTRANLLTPTCQTS
jgi:hypothetical protein